MANEILDDCTQSGEPSSNRTRARDIFNRPEFVSDTACVVIPLPGIVSARVPSTANLPSACVLRERADGRGSAYLQLRGHKVLVASGNFSTPPLTSQYLVLYLFDDGPALDIIPATEEVTEDISVHEMSAQSRHSFVDAPFTNAARDTFELPLVARRVMTFLASDIALEKTTRNGCNVADPGASNEQVERQRLDDIPF